MAVAGLGAPERFCNDARAGRPPQLPLSCYHMTAAGGLGASWKRSEKRLPGSPLAHTSSAGRGGARGLWKRHVRARSAFKTQGRDPQPEQGSSRLPPLPPSPFAAPLSTFFPLGPSLPHSPGPSSKGEGPPRAPGGGKRARSSLASGASCGKHPGETCVEVAPGTCKRETRALWSNFLTSLSFSLKSYAKPSTKKTREMQKTLRSSLQIVTANSCYWPRCGS